MNVLIGFSKTSPFPFARCSFLDLPNNVCIMRDIQHLSTAADVVAIAEEGTYAMISVVQLRDRSETELVVFSRAPTLGTEN